MGDRTISSLPTDVDDNLDNNNNNKDEQPPGLTECSFSSSESESSNNDINNGKDSKEIVVSLVEDSKMVVTSCGDEGYEIIPTTTKSTTTNNDDTVQPITTSRAIPTTKITPPSSNTNMNNNPTIEVETTTSTTTLTSTSTPTVTTSPPTDDNDSNTHTLESSQTKPTQAETSIYATLSSAAHSIRTRQISIATQPTSNAALSSSDIDENIEGVTSHADTQQADALKSTTADVDALASNNDIVLDNELTISTNKTQSKQLPRVQSDTVSEYYQWYEDNVR